MNHIENILALQEAELVIDSIRSEAQVFPDRLEGVQKEFDEKKRLFDEAETRLKALQAENADLKHTLDLEQQRLEKSRKKMRELTKPYEVQAMKKEIESTTRSNDDIETKIIEKDDDIEKSIEIKDGYKAELDIAQASLLEVKTEVDTKTGEFDKILKEKAKTKKSLESKCDQKTLNAYRMIRDRKYQDALVAVVEGACQGCFMNIPPQMANLMLKNQSQIEKCPHCQRLIFWHEESPEEE